MCLLFAGGGAVVLRHSGRLVDAADSSMEVLDSNIQQALDQLEQSEHVLDKLAEHAARGAALAREARPFVEALPGHIEDIEPRIARLAELAQQSEGIAVSIAGKLPLEVPTGIDIEWTKYYFPKPLDERYIPYPSDASVVRTAFLADEKKKLEAIGDGFAKLASGLEKFDALARESGPFIVEKGLPFLDSIVSQMEIASGAVRDFRDETLPRIRADVGRVKADAVQLRESLALIRWLAAILVCAGVLLSLYMIVNAMALGRLAAWKD